MSIVQRLRPEGLRLDWRQRRERQSDTQVYQGREVRDASRSGGTEQRQRRHAEPEPARHWVRASARHEKQSAARGMALARTAKSIETVEPAANPFKFTL